MNIQRFNTFINLKINWTFGSNNLPGGPSSIQIHCSVGSNLKREPFCLFCYYPSRMRQLTFIAKKRENLSWIRLINNNYINSSTQTRPEFGMNPFAPSRNSFKDNYKKHKERVILEGITTRSKWIHTEFWPGLSTGINIIIIY